MMKSMWLAVFLNGDEIISSSKLMRYDPKYNPKYLNIEPGQWYPSAN